MDHTRAEKDIRVVAPAGKGRYRVVNAKVIRSTPLAGHRYRLHLSNGKDVVATRSPGGRYVLVKKPALKSSAKTSLRIPATSAVTEPGERPLSAATRDKLVAILEMDNTGLSRRGVR
ncbi:hypothetical protein [Tsukamurella spumae]|uniref:Uncharacterized protein n=1 Tax=Tsukamurella spumae TaxID=44753 RepID=A0A846WX26_9ACTN|nr:hypothetical protein [Tsukamurella spumae]NKY17424.1 hypothetical protein [Tsukamurella spumae]